MVTMTPQREWMTIVPKRNRGLTDPGPLARILYKLRAERRWSQTEVARRAGWAASNSYYSDLERGDIRLPGKDKIADLERAFELEPGFIENQLPRREKFMMAPPAPPAPAVSLPAFVEMTPALQQTLDAVLLLHDDPVNLKRVRDLITVILRPDAAPIPARTDTPSGTNKP